MAEHKPQEERNEEQNHEWEKFDAFVKKLAAVPKEKGAGGLSLPAPLPAASRPSTGMV